MSAETVGISAMIIPPDQMKPKSRKRKNSGDGEGATTSTGSGRTLKQYSVDEKLSIIEYAKLSGNRAAGREYNVAESSIREWRKNEQKLINTRNASAGIIFNNNHMKSKEEKLQAERFAAQFNLFNIGYPTMLPMFSQHFPPILTAPTTSESVGTPSSSSSHSSSSTPPPLVSSSPTPSGAGRRKSRAPQKVLQEP
ncbi:unnamed protein product [Caenorhabditis angaria]|uniref:Brinker DNA-binding domain-containing protein n=1 Tax=Caenorhabditis angaria TaxID=860376 RepID=A0A9P1IX98_9PELO|nr:unnamed protein product [Caenorhabditis angaria]